MSAVGKGGSRSGRRLVGKFAPLQKQGAIVNKEVMTMPLSTDMRQLCRQFLDGYDSRLAAVAGIRTETAQALADSNAARQSMAAEQREQMAEYRQQLADHTEQMKEETGVWLGEVEVARQAVSVEQRQWLDEQRRQLGENVARLRGDAEAFLDQVDTAHQSMAADLRQGLDEQRDNLRREAEEFLAAVKAAHQAMAADQRQGLAEYDRQLDEQDTRLRQEAEDFLAAVKAARQSMASEQWQKLDEHGDRLRRDTGTFLADLQSARRSMAANQRQQLGEKMAQLDAERTDMVASVAAMRGNLIKDRDEARRTWTSFGKLKQQRRTRTSQTPTAPPKAAEPSRPHAKLVPVTAPPAPAPVEVKAAPSAGAADDLMAIRGIGPAMQSRLNKGGLHTYRQLATTTPDELHQILGDVSRLANLEEWISEARKLAGM